MTPATVDWIAVEGDYRAGQLSLREMADRHGTSESNIRKRANKNGWIRDPSGTKRELVKRAMAGDSAQMGAQCALRTIEQEAEQDVLDMRSGLDVARACLVRLNQVVGELAEPRDIKVVAEANRIAIDTIRRIRGLDDAASQQQNTIVGFRVEAA